MALANVTRRNLFANSVALGAILATPGCVAIAPAAADPMLVLLARVDRHWSAYCEADPYPDEVDDFDATHDGISRTILYSNPPTPTTKEGAIAAIRHIVDDRDFVQEAHACILKEVVRFLETI